MDDQVQAGGEGIGAGAPDGVSPTPPARSPRYRPAAGSIIALFIATVIIVATGIVLFGGRAQTISYPTDSPEAAVQGYLRAWYDKDLATAYSYFSSSVKSTTPLATYVSDDFCCYDSGSETVRIVRVSGTGPQRTVLLSVDRYYGGTDPYTTTETVPVVLEDGAWRIDQLMRGPEWYDRPY